jgi:hypothetical protein
VSAAKPEVKCLPDEYVYKAFKALCDAERIGYARKGEALIEAYVRAEFHRYILAKQAFEGLEFAGNLQDLSGLAK